MKPAGFSADGDDHSHRDTVLSSWHQFAHANRDQFLAGRDVTGHGCQSLRTFSSRLPASSSSRIRSKWGLCREPKGTQWRCGPRQAKTIMTRRKDFIVEHRVEGAAVVFVGGVTSGFYDVFVFVLPGASISPGSRQQVSPGGCTT
ncbi:MAG: hypothetical protein Ct9H300mP1_30660 [Planctomycetaceae bacterium]|nr:MAG: hypothetical protein Ct9H300mP1_30660 [Planctomycetaceae bacterium]